MFKNMGFYLFFPILLLSVFLTAGCSQLATSGNAGIPGDGGSGGGVLGALRPKADPALVEKIRQEEQARLLAQQNAAQNNDAQSGTDPMDRNLPNVSTDPIAPPAEEVAQSGGLVTPLQQNDSVWNNPAMSVSPASTSESMQTAVYGGNYAPSVPAPPPGSLAGGLVPPPPAITLSTQAQTMAYGGAIPMDPNVAPYGSPMYGYPYPQQWYPGQPPAVPAAAQALERPAGSPFGTGGKASNGIADEIQSERSKKLANFVPITPSGMDSRSAYKQRDDMKVLWKGALAGAAVKRWVNDDDRIAGALNRIDVGLPHEATRGSFSISQRQVDSFFKPVDLDKRTYHLAPAIKKLQNDLAQGYHRYLYAYNKFALAQQTVAARKQQVELASSASEQQRAAADLSQAQHEAESATDDMHSAQYELASIAGAPGARSIIGRVSGITPSLDSLAQAESAPAAQRGKFRGVASQMLGSLGSMGSLFHLGKKGEKEAPVETTQANGSTLEPAKVASADMKKSKKDKHRKEGDSGDLVPQPKVAAAITGAINEKEPAPAAKETRTNSNDGVSFLLNNVNVNNRKSILNVSIRNSGSNDFTFTPEVISVSENNHKLSEAVMRADFDATVVQPNQEVKGTITIFGRPWNEKLAVYLCEGGKNIQMRR